jgi:hypothetical protein
MHYLGERDHLVERTYSLRESVLVRVRMFSVPACFHAFDICTTFVAHTCPERMLSHLYLTSWGKKLHACTRLMICSAFFRV